MIKDECDKQIEIGWKRYTQEYKEIIVDLYKSGIALAENRYEYGIARSTIARQVKDTKQTKINERT